jgi:autotransporter-associated beta strand protein
LTENGAGKLALAKTDGGVWIVSGVNTYTGDTTVSAGTLRFATTTGSPSVGAAATATVASGATLELAGLVSDLGRSGGNRVHLVNNSTAPGLLVSGKNQVVGAIDGSGSVQINAGSDLTVNHIVQSTLIIGGASGIANRGRLTIDQSDASGNPLDQSTSDAFIGGLDSTAPGSDLLDSSLGGSSSELSSTASGLGAGPAAVPEPAALLLAIVALVAIGCCARRKCIRHAPRAATATAHGVCLLL